MPNLPKAKQRRKSTGNKRSKPVHKDYRWRLLSEKIRAVNPCEPCAYMGHVHESKDLDHIIPDGAPFNPENLMPMCKAMHGKKSQLDKEGFRVKARMGLGGLVPVDRLEILRALAEFDNRHIDKDHKSQWL